MTDRRWCRSPAARWRSLPDGVLLASPSHPEPIVVTGPGRDVWDLLGAGPRHDDLVASLGERYGTEAARVRRDVEALLADLAERGLVHSSDSPIAPAVVGATTPDDRLGFGVPVPVVALHDDTWASLLAFVRAERLEGPLAWAIDAGTWPATGVQTTEARDLHRRAMSLALLLEGELVELAAELDHHGVAMRVLKGPAVAHLDEVDPAMRSFGDVDLLVRGDDFATATAIVEGRGGRRRFAEPRPGFDRRFTKGASFTFERNVEIDLHRTLAPGPFGLTIDLDELFDRTEAFLVGDATLLALDGPSRFLHACIHAMLGRSTPRVSALRDVVHTAPSSDPELHVTLDRSRRWQLDPVVAAAVAAAAERLVWAVPEPLATWARRSRPTPRQRRWLEAYAGDRRSAAAQAIHGVAALRGPRRKVAYATAIALPASSDRRGLAARWSRGVRALRQPHRP